MICAIMQPSYLPWSGYFHLISSVDHFVFLDNVQYERRSWQMRNRILLNGLEHMLSIPLAKCPQSTLLKEVLVSNDRNWRAQHWDILEQAYKKAPHGQVVLELLYQHYFDDEITEFLSKFTKSIIINVSKTLGLSATFSSASSLLSGGVRSARLASLCNSIGCDAYMSPVGSKEYLEYDDFEKQFGIHLVFQNFKPMQYTQFRSDRFVSHLSIIDVIANLGLEKAGNYVRTGHE